MPMHINLVVVDVLAKRYSCQKIVSVLPPKERLFDMYKSDIVINEEKK